MGKMNCEKCDIDMDVYWYNDNGIEGYYCENCANKLMDDSRNDKREVKNDGKNRAKISERKGSSQRNH